MERIRSLVEMPPGVARIVRLAVSLGVLVIVALTVGSEEMLTRLLRADPMWLLAAFLALNVQTLLCAVRWRLTAARVGQRIGLFTSVVEYYVAQLINQVVPGGVVGDVGRAARTRHTVGLFLAGQAVALERLSGQLALGVVGLVAITVTAIFPGGLRWPPVVGLCIVAVLVVLFLLRTLTQNRFLRQRVPRSIANVARLAWQALAAPDVRYWQIVLSFGTAACNIIAFAFCAWATGTDLSLGAAAALVPLILIAMLIPVGVAGWGFREGAAAALFPLVSASAGAGVAASVSFGAMLLAASLPGLLPLAIGGGSRPTEAPKERARHAPSDKPPALTRSPLRPPLR